MSATLPGQVDHDLDYDQAYRLQKQKHGVSKTVDANAFWGVAERSRFEPASEVRARFRSSNLGVDVHFRVGRLLSMLD